MYLPLDNLQMLICHKTQQTKPNDTNVLQHLQKQNKIIILKFRIYILFLLIRNTIHREKYIFTLMYARKLMKLFMKFRYL